MLKTSIRELFTKQARRGQALVEYALILALVAIGFGFALAATGPVIGNVFSNTVYNLIGQTPELRELPDAADFWLTVTWVAENPLAERTLPPRTLAPPTTVPTAGPSPTPTEVIPTNTPLPTQTPVPTNTPMDFAFDAPYLDTVDTPRHWRIDASQFLGTADWFGYYYAGMDLDYNGAEPAQALWNRALYGSKAYGVLDFPNPEYVAWQNANGGPLNGWPEANPYDFFSIRFVREIYVPGPDPVILNFHLTSDDGARMWLLGEGQSAATCSNVPHPSTSNGRVQSGAPATAAWTRSSYGDDSAYANDCLMIDAWIDQSPTTTSVTRTIQPGHYRLQVDYYERQWGAELRLDINIPSNPDDQRVSGSGGVDCNWGQIARQQDANSLQRMWQEYVGGDFPVGQRCHLEFRGYVYVPTVGSTGQGGAALTPMDRPELVFWDVWDMQRAGHTAWLEVAEYIPQPGTDRALDRDQLNWIRVDLHQGATVNYNWTRNVVDLTNVGGVDFRGKRLTFRFVMQATETGTRRWYIDDVEVREGTVKNFLPGTFWDLNTPDQRADFITSGHWDLTANNALPDPDTANNPSGCCSWEISPGERVYQFSESPWGTESNRVRVHYVELDGWVDYSGNLPDDEGHTGWPVLSFYHGYDVSNRVGLEVQYTLDPPGVGPTNWQVVPGDPGDLTPAGQIRTIYENRATDRLLHPIDVTLRNIPADRFRLRFAVLAHSQASEDWAASDGWWIDDIYLHREDPPGFLDYPFYDDAETGMDNWIAIGTWGRTNLKARVGDHSFADSPGTNYGNNQSLRLEFTDPIDFCNNTQANLDLTDRNMLGGNSGGPAIDPVLTFWHTRDLAADDHFYVDWRRYDEPGNWQPLWFYFRGMTSTPHNVSTSLDGNWASQLAWEYVEIDLRPIYNAGACSSANETHDDILFRFRVETDANNVADGVYIDDIRIAERQQRSIHLWPSSVGYDAGNGNMIFGDGAFFTANLEESDWAERWHAGGDWVPIAWEQRRGLLSWHESTLGQGQAPDYYDRWWNDSIEESDITRTPINTMHILEIAPVIDLRGTNASVNPMLTFWTRYHVGRYHRISVQISEELTPSSSANDLDMDGRCRNLGAQQCYEQVYDWSPWRNTEFAPSSDYATNYAWHREQISLTSYAGKRIRIRFVFNALRGNINESRDGWYIDNVTIGPRNNRVIKVISEGAFYDGARNMANWVGEGGWGLSPEFYRGEGGGPTTMGVWQERLWHVGSTERSLYSPQLRNTMRERAHDFLNLPRSEQDLIPHKAYREVLNINYSRASGEVIRPGVLDRDTNIVGEWVMDVGPIGLGIQPGDYTFITVSDDGVRMRYEEIDAAGNLVNPPASAPSGFCDTWNIICYWQNTSPRTEIGAATLEQGKRYRFTLQWYENTGGMRIILTTGGSTFSFTDTPKQGPGPGFPDVPAIMRSNSSLISDGVFDLSGTTDAVLEYYTYYEVDDGIRVEVSRDGGFTWEQTGLGATRTLPFGGSITYDNPTRTNATHMPSNHDMTNWQRRRHSLHSFAGEQIMIRFRLRHWDNIRTSRSNNSYLIGWWITDITIGE